MAGKSGKMGKPKIHEICVRLISYLGKSMQTVRQILLLNREILFIFTTQNRNLASRKHTWYQNLRNGITENSENGVS